MCASCLYLIWLNMLIIHDVTLTFVILSETSSFLRVEINSVVCFVMYNFLLLTYVFVWVFVMHIFVRMTIHILMGFRHVHVCTNDYPYYFCMGFRHAHLFTNDHPFSHGFSSCTCLYEWLFIPVVWVFVMHISVQMTIHFFWMGFRHEYICTNDYLFSCEWVFAM